MSYHTDTHSKRLSEEGVHISKMILLLEEGDTLPAFYVFLIIFSFQHYLMLLCLLLFLFSYYACSQIKIK